MVVSFLTSTSHSSRRHKRRRVKYGFGFVLISFNASTVAIFYLQSIIISTDCALCNYIDYILSLRRGFQEGEHFTIKTCKAGYTIPVYHSFFISDNLSSIDIHLFWGRNDSPAVRRYVMVERCNLSCINSSCSDLHMLVSFFHFDWTKVYTCWSEVTNAVVAASSLVVPAWTACICACSPGNMGRPFSTSMLEVMTLDSAL